MKKRDVLQFCGNIVSPLSSTSRAVSHEFMSSFIKTMRLESKDYICGQGRYRNIYLPVCAMVNDFAKLDHTGMINGEVRHSDIECIKVSPGIYLFLFNNRNRVSGKVVDLIDLDSAVKKSLNSLDIDVVIFDAFQSYTVFDSLGQGFNDGGYTARDNSGETFYIPPHIHGSYEESARYGNRRRVRIIIGYSNGFTRNGITIDKDYTTTLKADNSISRLTDAVVTCNIPKKEYNSYLRMPCQPRYIASYANRIFIKNCRIIKDEIN